jgi:hypothetical protein
VARNKEVIEQRTLMMQRLDIESKQLQKRLGDLSKAPLSEVIFSPINLDVAFKFIGSLS